MTASRQLFSLASATLALSLAACSPSGNDLILDWDNPRGQRMLNQFDYDLSRVEAQFQTDLQACLGVIGWGDFKPAVIKTTAAGATAYMAARGIGKLAVEGLTKGAPAGPFAFAVAGMVFLVELGHMHDRQVKLLSGCMYERQYPSLNHYG